jgi:hypothetical protein
VLVVNMVDKLTCAEPAPQDPPPRGPVVIREAREGPINNYHIGCGPGPRGFPTPAEVVVGRRVAGMAARELRPRAQEETNGVFRNILGL